MLNMEKEISIRIKNQRSELDSVKKLLDDFYSYHQLPKKPAYAVDLSIEELLVNIISYAFEDEKTHFIHIQVSLSGEALAVRIDDDGKPFNPLEAAEPDVSSPLEKRQVGGLGLHLVKKLMDSIHYQYEAGRNCLTIKKNIR